MKRQDRLLYRAARRINWLFRRLWSRILLRRDRDRWEPHFEIVRLEDRRLLSASYVDAPGDWFVDNDVNVVGTLDSGDEVTWRQGTASEKTGLIYGETAFGTIQSAVNAAAADDIVRVAPGVYREDLTIATANLTLQGAPADRDAVIIEGVSTLPWGSWPLASPNIDVQADGVTIRDLTIRSPVVPDGAYSSGMVIDGENVTVTGNRFVLQSEHTDAGGAGAVTIQTYRGDVLGHDSNLDGLQVTDNVFQGNPHGGYVGVFINLQGEAVGDTVTVSGNSMSGTVYQGVVTERSEVSIADNTITSTLGAGQGVAVQDFVDAASQSDVTVSGNTISGFSTGVRVGNSAGTQDLTNIQVQDNSILNNTTGVQVRADAGAVTVNGNAFADAVGRNGNTTAVVNNDTVAALDASGNWWGSNAQVDVVAAIGGAGTVNYTPYLRVRYVDDPGNSLINGSGYAGDWYVESDNGTVGTLDAGDIVTWRKGDTESEVANQIYGTTAFGTIQDAIIAAAAGDTVHVAPGVYEEQLTINQRLNLLGPSDPDDATPDETTHAILQPSAAPAAGVPDVAINASGVTIEDMVFDFNGSDNDRGGLGIFVSDLNGPAATGVTIRDNAIYTGDGGGVGGTGIQTGKNANVGNLLVTSNYFYGDADGSGEGVYINPGTGTGITITDNKFRGKLFSAVSIETGNVSVSGNDIHSDASKGLYGIRFIDLAGGQSYSNVSIGRSSESANTIRNVQYGIRVGTSTDVSSTLTASIENNEISDTDTAVWLRDGAHVTFEGNTFSDGSIVAEANAEFAPGSGPAITATEDLSLETGSTLNIQIDGTAGAGVTGGHDQVHVTTTGTSNVDLDSDDSGGATLNVILGYAPSAGDSFKIIDNDGTDAIQGTFASPADSGTFTVGSTLFHITYAGINDVVLTANTPPTFNGGATLAAVDEDTANPPGATVSSLLSGNFSDTDNDNFTGIAITADASDSSQGTWQYSTDGTNWHDLGTVSTAAALLLDTSSSLRFFPASNYQGSPGSLTVFAVEDSASTTFTSGATRQTFDTTTDSATSHVATSGVSLGTSITPVNDAPTLSGLDNVTFAENTVNAAPQTIDSTVTLEDIDSSNLNGGTLTVTYTAGGETQDQLGVLAGNGITLAGSEVRHNGNAMGDITGNGLNGSDLVISFDTNEATPTAVDALIQQLSYQNTSDNPTATRTIGITITDGDGGSSTQQTAIITVNAEDDDTEAPTVSITRDDTTPTKATSVAFSVDFNEEVQNVNAGDFVVAKTGTADGNAAVSVDDLSDGDPKTFQVTISGVSGTGTLGLDIDSGTDIEDLAGNALDQTATPNEVYTIDNTAPTTTLTFPSDGSSYNASGWTDKITGTASDTGGGSVSQVEVSIQRLSDNKYWSGSAFDSDVEVFHTASLTLPDWELAFADTNLTDGVSYTVAAHATDTAGNEETTATATFTYDTTAPTVSSIVLADSDPTNASSVDFTVTFSESVTGVGTGDFVIDQSGLTGASVTGIAGNGKTYTVTAGTGSGDGTLSIDFDHAADGGVTDAGGNVSTVGYTAGQAYTVDKTKPSTSLTFPSDGSSYNASGWTDKITGTASDTGGGSVSQVEVSIQRLSDNKYWSGSAFDSDVEVFHTASLTLPDWELAFADTNLTDGVSYTVAAHATDTAGNEETTATATFTYDTTAPTVTSILRQMPSTSPTNADEVTFRLTFSEEVVNVGTADFSLSGTAAGDGSVNSVLAVTGSSVFDVSITGLTSSNGTIDLDFSSGQDIADASGNALVSMTPVSEETYTIDNTAPTVAITLDDTALKAGETATVTFTFSETPNGFAAGDITAQSGDISNLQVDSLNDKVYTAMFTPAVNTEDLTNVINVGTGYTDAAGNTGAAGDSLNYTVDTLAPTVTVSIVDASLSDSDNSSDVTITFSEAVTDFDTSDLTPANGSLSSFSGSGSSYSVTFTAADGIDDAGSVTVGTAYTDLAGNPGGMGSDTVIIDTENPTVASIVRANADPTNATSVDFTVTFNEAVTGVQTTDFQIDATVTGASVTAVSGGGGTYTVSVNSGSGDGTLSIDFDNNASGGVADLAGNVSVANYNDGEAYTIATTEVVLSNKKLVINDIRSTTNDTLSISVAGGNVDISDPANTVAAGSGVTKVNNNKVSVPLASIAGGSITFNTGDGDDVIVVGPLDLKTLGYSARLIIDGQDDNDTVNVNGAVDLNAGALQIDTVENITVNSPVTANGIALTAQDAVTLNAGLDAGGKTITIAANQDGSGSEGFSQTAGTIQTTNTETDAVNISVNASGAGTGGAALGNIKTGNGGRITVTTGTGGGVFGGSITQAAATLLDVGVGAVVLSTPTGGASGIGTTGNNILTKAGTITASAGSGGVFITEADGASFTATVVGAGHVQLTNNSGTLDIVGATNTFSGNIVLSSGDAVVLSAALGGASFSGTVTINANINGGSEGFAQNSDGTIETTNDTADAVRITVGGSGGAALRSIVAGTTTGGRVTIDSGGAITDADGDSAANITAQSAILDAEVGIGTGGWDAEDKKLVGPLGSIDVDVDEVVANNNGSGDIHLRSVRNHGGGDPLQIGTDSSNGVVNRGGSITIIGPLSIVGRIERPGQGILTWIPDGSYLALDHSAGVTGGRMVVTIENWNPDSENYATIIDWSPGEQDFDVFETDGETAAPSIISLSPTDTRQRLERVFETKPPEPTSLFIRITVAAPDKIFLIDSDQDSATWMSYPVIDNGVDHEFTVEITVPVDSFQETPVVLETSPLTAPEVFLTAESLASVSSETIVAAPPPSFFLLSSAQSTAVSRKPRGYLLQVLFDDADAQTADVQDDNLIPIGNRLDLVKIAKKLPDQRYRIYFQHEDGSREHVKDIVVRDGKPYEMPKQDEHAEPKDAEPEDDVHPPSDSETDAADAAPGDERPSDVPADGQLEEPAATEPPGRPVGQTDPRVPPEQPEDITSRTLGRSNAMARGGALLSAALVGPAAAAAWQRQADEALRQHDRLGRQMLYRSRQREGDRPC